MNMKMLFALKRLERLRIAMQASADTARERLQTPEYDAWDNEYVRIFGRNNTAGMLNRDVIAL